MKAPRTPQNNQRKRGPKNFNDAKFIFTTAPQKKLVVYCSRSSTGDVALANLGFELPNLIVVVHYFNHCLIRAHFASAIVIITFHFKLVCRDTNIFVSFTTHRFPQKLLVPACTSTSYPL